MNLKRRIHRVKFKEWTRLEDLRDAFVRAAESKQDFPKKFYAYLSAALGVKEDELSSRPWYEVIEIFHRVYQVNFPSSVLPLVTAIEEKIKPVKPEWDYPGRTWHFYAHMLAKSYGWGLDEIANLEIEEALALVQEVLTEEQLDREFLWGMSEIAYPYNKATKDNRFHPLPRPYFMRPVSKEIKKVKIHKSMMPQGLIINVGQIQTVVPEAQAAQSEDAHAG